MVQPFSGPVEEQELIRLLNPANSSDDCALIEHGGQPYLYTTDSLAEGTHFRMDWSSPEDIAWKLLHVNLSDLLAAGGEPEFCLCNLGLPSVEDGFVHRFADALNALLEEQRISLVGGDTFRCATAFFSLTLSGPALQPRFRRAMAGDDLYVSGTLGGSRTGYDWLKKNGMPEDRQSEFVDGNGQGTIPLNAIRRHLRPTAPMAAARQLNAMQENGFPIHGAMDVSDGIFADCLRFAQSAGLSLEVNLDQLPLHPQCSGEARYAASSGEELELLIASSAALPDGFVRIGKFGDSKDSKCSFLLHGERVEPEGGFEHFSS